MLKKHSQFFKSLNFIFDSVIIVFAWLSSYYLRFYLIPVPLPEHNTSVDEYIIFLIPIILIWGIAFQAFGL
ncbi:MAG: undecaprenyl-phosphate glucose phosphotransferase, partial [Nitrospirota bacterium]